MKLRYIIEFYITVAIPLIYFFVLYTISLGGTLVVPLFFQLFGLAISLIGLIFWIASYIHLGKSFGVLPRRQPKVTSGIYARYKHPMYIGITLTFFGLALANQSMVGILTTICLLIPILYIRAKLEESKLVH